MLDILLRIFGWSVVAWIVYCVIHSIILKRKQEGVIFIDLTDLFYSFSSLIIPIVAGFILESIFKPTSHAGNATITIIRWLIFVGLSYFLIMNTFYSNKNKYFQTASIVTAKFFLSFFFIAVLFSSPEGKGSNQSDLTHQANIKEHQAFKRFMLLLIGGIMAYLVNKYRFSSLKSYFNFNVRYASQSH